MSPRPGGAFPPKTILHAHNSPAMRLSRSRPWLAIAVLGATTLLAASACIAIVTLPARVKPPADVSPGVQHKARTSAAASCTPLNGVRHVPTVPPSWPFRDTPQIPSTSRCSTQLLVGI